MICRHTIARTLGSAMLLTAGACRFDSSPLPSAGGSPTSSNGAPSPSSFDQEPASIDFGNPPPRRTDAGNHAMPAIDADAPLAPSDNRRAPPEHATQADADAASSNVADAGITDAAGNDAPIPDADPPGQQAPTPGSIFAACRSTAECSSGLLCTATNASGASSTLGYCAAPCDLTGGCAQPSGGMVRATCSAGVCMLDSCERAACPYDMQCVRTDVVVVPGLQSTVFGCQPAR